MRTIVTYSHVVNLVNQVATILDRWKVGMIPLLEQVASSSILQSVGRSTIPSLPTTAQLPRLHDFAYLIEFNRKFASVRP